MEALVLFVLVDAGESDMLSPVIRQLNSAKVLCFGTAETLPLSLGSAQVIKGQDLGLSKPITKVTPRTEGLNSEDLAALDTILSSAKVIVTGVAGEGATTANREMQRSKDYGMGQLQRKRYRGVLEQCPLYAFFS